MFLEKSTLTYQSPLPEFFQDGTCLRSTVSDDHFLNPLVRVWFIHAIKVTFYHEVAIENEY